MDMALLSGIVAQGGRGEKERLGLKGTGAQRSPKDGGDAPDVPRG